MSLMLIGDTGQSLFLWRHSYPDIMEHLGNIFSTSKKSFLLKNYRSPKQLVLLANYFRKFFDDHGLNPAPSEPHLDFMKDVLTIKRFENSNTEIKQIIEKIKTLKKEEGILYSDVAILARTNRTLFDFEAGFIAASIPYTIKYDSRSLLNQSPFKFIYSLYSILLNQRDIASLCELLVPIRGIGPKFIEQVQTKLLLILPKIPGFSIFEDIKLECFDKQSKQVKTFISFVNRVLIPIKKSFEIRLKEHSFVSFNNSISSILRDILQFDGDNDDPEKIPFTMEFYQIIKTLEVLNQIYTLLADDFEFKRYSEHEKFIGVHQSLSLSQDIYNRNSENSEGKETVTLSTVHSFKGMENKYIFGVSLNSHSPIDFYDFEEKCVFYVLITRACRQLNLSYSDLAFSFGNILKPSCENPFVNRYMEGVRDLKEKMKHD